ncbi:DUF305 domain-containing protein [Streptomyces sp. MJP52]|uniref:DUF305 domain-containing protein n=1 Tax=Streptomyces sp. MJP52 TaxID=2940555 RepID=UPI0024746A21|nr:DUF305 domain-containing protein [Streptomyces sp. MJP52]MDH6228340.1 uncharacterized protein (DUF305 family) [Streptomyces sp. MJP52]
MSIRRVPRTALVTAALSLGLLALGGCDSGADDGPGAAQGSSVIAPGRPGEPNRTLSPEEAARHRKEDDSPNAADVSYVRMMIEHHEQALEMARLAPDRAKSKQVKGLASRIADVQGAEIDMMEGWLDEHGAGKDAGGHEHRTMRGMATPEQMEELEAADGAGFDGLFLELMIAHHEGAIAMASDVKANGNNLRAEEMADDVIATQTTEIARMEDMRG